MFNERLHLVTEANGPEAGLEWRQASLRFVSILPQTNSAMNFNMYISGSLVAASQWNQHSEN